MLVNARHSVYMILGRVCVGPLCAYVSEHSGSFGVCSCGVRLVFVGASVCAVLLGVVAPAMSCGRFCSVLCLVRGLCSLTSGWVLAVLVSVIVR